MQFFLLLFFYENAVVPVMATHAAAKSIKDHPRNLSDEALRAIASTGGVIGVMSLRSFIGESSDDELFDKVVKHIDYIVDLVGIDFVGIASDAYVNGYPHDGRVVCSDGDTYVSSSNLTAQFTLGRDLNAPTRWKKVIAALANITINEGSRYKYSVDDLKKIAGGNFIRVMRDALPGYSKPSIVTVEKRDRNGIPKYYIDWEEVRVNRAANLDVGIPRYKVSIYGETDDGYKHIYTSNDISSSQIEIYSTIKMNLYSKYKGFIKAINPRNTNEYVNSSWFYFER